MSRPNCLMFFWCCAHRIRARDERRSTTTVDRDDDDIDDIDVDHVYRVGDDVGVRARGVRWG